MISTFKSRPIAKPRLSTCKVNAGMKFGKWTLLSDTIKGKQRYWKCQCECGIERDVNQSSLVQSKSKSCGKCADHMHGMTLSPEWESWGAMKARCDCPSHTAYHRYGGRGISYDPAWKNIERFVEDMGKRPEGTSLDRIDNDKGYSKENCRWATHKEQSRNMSKNRLVEFQGALYPVSALAEKLGIKVSTMFARVRMGVPLDRPVKGKK